MNIYRMHEAEVVLPSGWQDQSINIFVSGSDPFDLQSVAGECSVVVTRAPRPAEQNLYGFVSAQVKELTRALPQFRLIQQLSLQLGDTPAEQAEYVWSGENGPMRQMQTCVFAAQTVLTLTATTREALWPRYEFQIQSLLYSLQVSRQGKAF